MKKRIKLDPRVVALSSITSHEKNKTKQNKKQTAEYRYNAVQYCKINNYRIWSRILIRCWTRRRHPIPRPKRPSYRLSFVNICEKIDRAITAPYSIWTSTEKAYLWYRQHSFALYDKFGVIAIQLCYMSFMAYQSTETRLFVQQHVQNNSNNNNNNTNLRRSKPLITGIFWSGCANNAQSDLISWRHHE